MRRFGGRNSRTSLFPAKHFARDDFLHERTQAVMIFSRLFDDPLHLCPIRETETPTQAIGQKLFGDAAGDAPGVALEQRFEIANAIECLARQKLSTGVYRQS